MSNPEASGGSGKNLLNSSSSQITMKLLLIGALIIGLLIPRYMVVGLVQERSNYSQQVNAEVASNWGGDQNLTGPFLIIPYVENVIEKVDGKILSTEEKRQLLVNPQELRISGDIATDRKYRSLYEVVLYSGRFAVSGNFRIPPIEEMELKPENLRLQEAFIVFLIGDAKGVQRADRIKVNGRAYDFKPSPRNLSVTNIGLGTPAGVEPNEISQTDGMHALVPLSDISELLDFSFDLELKGSNLLTVAPVAKRTSVHLRSPFPDPVFTGNFATDAGTRVDAKGFDARWTVTEFQRNIPAFVKNARLIDLQGSGFGVNISTQIDNYTKTERAAKYMVLIIAFTFLVVFVTEIVNGLRIHIFQYTLIGLAIVIFFTLLLSIGEYLKFDWAYAISALAVIGLITAYSRTVFRHNRSVLILLGALSGLFLFMYMIIQMEKYSLITGSIGVFLALAVTMYATRRIQFFENSAR